MSAPAKKRKLSIFSLPKTEKEAKKISRLLIELQKDYFVNSLELEYEDENATGWIRCSGECTNKNKPFSAKGARQLICSEKSNARFFSILYRKFSTTTYEKLSYVKKWLKKRRKKIEEGRHRGNSNFKCSNHCTEVSFERFLRQVNLKNYILANFF